MSREFKAKNTTSKVSLGLFFAISITTLAFAGKELPPPPPHHVWDEPKVVSPKALKALQTLLFEHDRLTSEQIVIALFQDLEGEDLVDFTSHLFSVWKIGQSRTNNGVLLALYWKNKKARIEVGYGLEPILTDAKSKRILNHFLIPELRAGNPDRAITLATLEILNILESPLIQSGKAQEIVREGGIGGSSEDWTSAATHAAQRGMPAWVILVCIGGVLLFFVLYVLTAAEAHFTGSGWHQANPWGGRTRPRRTLRGSAQDRLGGGLFGGSRGWGGSGGGFGGGLFRGGGGISGGGGASGSW